MNNKHRSYQGKAVEMLMVCRTIAESFKENIAELTEARNDWTPAYADDLIKRIDDAMSNYLGVDSRKDLRAATQALLNLQTPAQQDLVFFKTQVADDFRKDPARRDEILRTLGFTQFQPYLHKGNHEVLIQLLFTFSTNLTPEIRAEAISKGMKEALIDRILSYARALAAANLSQETFKATWQEVSKDVNDVFNEIYAEVIGLCKKCSVFYRGNKLKRHHFSYSRVLANLGNGSRTNGQSQPEPAPAPIPVS
jgi:hypothetical protein